MTSNAKFYVCSDLNGVAQSYCITAKSEGDAIAQYQQLTGGQTKPKALEISETKYGDLWSGVYISNQSRSI